MNKVKSPLKYILQSELCSVVTESISPVFLTEDSASTAITRCDDFLSMAVVVFTILTCSVLFFKLSTTCSHKLLDGNWKESCMCICYHYVTCHLQNSPYLKVTL